MNATLESFADSGFVAFKLGLYVFIGVGLALSFLLSFIFLPVAKLSIGSHFVAAESPL